MSSSSSTSKMKRFVSIKGVIDNLRQSVNSPAPNSAGPGAVASGSGEAGGPARLEQDIVESLIPEQFTAEYTLRHGFPNKPTALAFDPMQKIMAIGNRSGVVRLYGKPGVDIEFKHDKESAVFKIIFVVNTGRSKFICSTVTNMSNHVMLQFSWPPPTTPYPCGISRPRRRTKCRRCSCHGKT